MRVRDGMSATVLTVGPGHTLRSCATQMAERNVGAAVVHDPDAPGPGIITERDILRSVGAGENPDTELVAAHLTSQLVFATPEWSLEEAVSVTARRTRQYAKRQRTWFRRDPRIVWLAAGFTIASGLHYIWQGVHFLNAAEREETDEAPLLR